MNPARVPAVDALRGFALLGIIIVNSTYLASTFTGLEVTDPATQGFVQSTISWTITALFETKFYLLFSFLFGYSFTLLLDSAARRGAPFAATFGRRLLGLALLGAAHALLLFVGDILTTYALLGLILLLCRALHPRTALITAGVIIAIMAAGFLALAAVTPAHPLSLDDPALTSQALQAADAYRSHPADIIGQHLAELPATLGVLWGIQAPCALAAFLVGLAVGKRRLLDDPAAHTRGLRKLATVGAVIGLPGAAFFAWSQSRPGTAIELVGWSVDMATAPALTAAYVCLFLLAATHQRTAAAISRFGPAGRMALSNYLAQSLTLALVFTGYGAGLVNRLNAGGVLAVAVAVYLLLATVSTWWTRRYLYGPLEWLLRALTNLSLPGWRRRPEAEPGTRAEAKSR